MSELDELRQRRMMELQMRQQMESQLQAQEVEGQIKHIVQNLLAPDAQQRLSNIRLARPEFARQIEILLIQLYQGGRLKKMNDEQFKALLSKIRGSKRESSITVR